jgi:stage V sporulation protein AD
VPFAGLFGACSTMAEALALGAALCSSGAAQNLLAMTSSHFCAAERQFRTPLSYGAVRTPTAQWTATAAGCCLLRPAGQGVGVAAATLGRVQDYNIKDINNMGAAMAPAAFSTISTFFTDTGMTPSDFDYIVTGDLGKVGSRILCELFERENINIRDNHKDCGMMLYDFDEQDIHAGGSGCGCAGSVLCGYFLPKLRAGEIKNILFAATGALMSPTVNQQGESIPSISHLVWLSGRKDTKGAN